MHIEIKNNRIIIEFTEEETSFIQQKAGTSEVEDISNYIKGKLVKALSLDALENTAMPNVGKDFNLNKIKKVTDELKKSNSKSSKAAVAEQDLLREETVADVSSVDNEPVSVSHKIEQVQLNEQGQKSDENEDEASEITPEEIGDELLADLLDNDLLKGRRKPKKERES